MPSMQSRKPSGLRLPTSFKDYDEHLLFAACNEPGMNETSSKGKKWTDAEAV